VGSTFSDFSSEGSDQSEPYPLPSIEEPDGPFSEQAFNIKTILEILTRVSTAIRRSGAKYRHRKADASLNEQDFEDLKKHLAFLIRKGTLQLNGEEPVAENSIISQDLAPELLSAVQQRLIHANVVRRNIIIFATRDKYPLEAPAAEQSQQQDSPGMEGEPAVHITPKPTQTVSDEPIASLQAPSIKASSNIQSATDIGSQFNLQAAAFNKTTPSIMTWITRTGATQDYPNCPPHIPGEILRCPYCADLLSIEYSSNSSRWRYGI